MASPAENPFTALTIVVAPAILTNASSLLCFGTANRLARVMDRTRAVSAQLAGVRPNEGNRAIYEHELRGLEVRWNLILDRKSTRLNSSHLVISYAVFCLKKKKNNKRLSQEVIRVND